MKFDPNEPVSELNPPPTTAQVWVYNNGKPNAQRLCPCCYRVGAHADDDTRGLPGFVACGHCGEPYAVPPDPKGT